MRDCVSQCQCVYFGRVCEREGYFSYLVFLLISCFL